MRIPTPPRATLTAVRLCLLLLALTLLLARPGVPGGYDLIVYGATPQGVTASVAAARRGLRVLLLEPSDRPGGVLTNGWLATLDMSTDSGGQLLNYGLFARFFRAIGHQPSFDVKRAEQVLRGWLGEAGVDVRYGARLKNVEVAGGKVAGVEVTWRRSRAWLSAPLFLDASDTAELAYAAGAPFTVGREDTGLDRRQMAATLVFRLTGVDWDLLGAALSAETATDRRPVGWRGKSAYGFHELADRYRPSDPERFALRGLNVARQDDNSLLVNGLLIFGVDGTQPNSLARGRRGGAAEAARVVAFLRQSEPGVFGAAALAGVAPQLYVRESRHLLGQYRLGAPYALFGAAFGDGVARGGYPLDGQAYLPGDPLFLLGRPLPYQIPLRSLLPRNLKNLLVVSQAASFESVAAYSARVVPTQMALGEAAGKAAWLSRVRGVPPARLASDPEAVARLRDRPWTSAQGRNISESGLAGYASAGELLSRGLLSAPYSKRGRLDLAGPMSPLDFMSDLAHLLGARGAPGGFWPAWNRLNAALIPYADTPISEEQANVLLARLGLPGFESAGSPEALFTRGRAARVLYGLMLGARGASAPVSCRECDSCDLCK